MSMNHSIEMLHSKKSKMIDLFLRMSENMINISDENIFMNIALADIGSTLKASRVYIFDYRDPYWYNTFEWVSEGVVSLQQNFQGVAFGFMEQLEGTIETFLAGKPKVIEHISKASREEQEFFATQGIVSMITVPLFYMGEFIGFFGIDQCEEVENWVQDTVTVAETMGHLLNNAKAHFNAQAKLQNEETLAKQMLDVLPIPFYVVNPKNYELVLYNKAFADFVNVEPSSAVTCYKILHGYDRPCDICGIHNSDGQQTMVWQHHNEKFQTDFTVIANKISWEEIDLAYAVAFMDITDSLLIQRKQVLERESVKMKGRFLANMSHELRTPVNGIMGITRLAEKQSTNPQVLYYLEKIQHSSENLLIVINNILDFLKLEAGKMTAEQCPFVVKELFEKLRKEFLPLAKNKGLNLKFSYEENTPAVLHGDSLRFSQVIHNLLSNAIKFTEQGYVQVDVRTMLQKDSDNCILQVIVSDTGIGMSENHVEKLFDVFFRADDSFARHQGGAGVGLPLAQGLLNLLNGNMIVSSESGKGSVFQCTAPFLLGKASDLRNRAQCADQEEISLVGLKVLLAEDNEINVIIAKEMLESFHCCVQVAEHGEQVLELLEKNAYDIILMDLEMPRMNGFEATARIRADSRFAQLPIIGMSAHSVHDMKNHEQLSGMQDYVTKPFDPQHVATLLYAYTHGNKKDFFDS